MKQTGGAVATTLLQNHPAARSLVGVFYSDLGIWNAPERIGSDVAFVHNPFTQAPLEPGTFTFTRNEWIPGPDGTIIPRSLRHPAGGGADVVSSP